MPAVCKIHKLFLDDPEKRSTCKLGPPFVCSKTFLLCKSPRPFSCSNKFKLAFLKRSMRHHSGDKVKSQKIRFFRKREFSRSTMHLIAILKDGGTIPATTHWWTILTVWTSNLLGSQIYKVMFLKTLQIWDCSLILIKVRVRHHRPLWRRRISLAYRVDHRFLSKP